MTELLDRHRRVMGDGAPLFYDEPLQLVKGEGVWLESADGRRYLDLYNNVPCVGHANPQVVAKLAEQAATLNVHSRYLHRWSCGLRRAASWSAPRRNRVSHPGL